MAPFPELLKVVRLALMPPAKVKHRKPHQATVFVRLLSLRRVLLSRHWLLLFGSAGAFAEAIIRSLELIIQWGCVWICLVSRLPQRSFVYLVSVYVLDPNLQPVAPPLIRFENGVLGIVGNYFGGLFSALSFDFPSHVRSPMEAGRSLLARKSTQQNGTPLPAAVVPQQRLRNYRPVVMLACRGVHDARGRGIPKLR